VKKTGDQLAIIILAAGASRRLGQPKQLVQYQGKPLIRRVAEACVASQLGEVFVILGSEAGPISKALKGLPDVWIMNFPDWAEGMGSSMAFATKSVLLDSSYDAAIFVLSDQFHFSDKCLQDLYAERKKTGNEILLSKYDEGKGPPSLFNKSMFEELSKLAGDDGAKAIVKNHDGTVGQVGFPKGHLDIDTQEDLALLKQRK